MKIEEIANKEVKLFEDGQERYSFLTVITENTLILTWILTGGYLCQMLLPLVGWIYLIYGFSMVLIIMRILVCKNCYYHGKVCHTGWGKLASLYTKQGEITRFGCGFSGAIIPIFYASMTLVPLIIGIISIVKKFSVIDLSILLVFFAVAFLSSFPIRKTACVKCKMKEICPGSLDK